MRIKRSERSSDVRFDSLLAGDVFAWNDDIDGSELVCMRLFPQTKLDWNTVDLTSGELRELNDDDTVVPLDGAFVEQEGSER